MNENLLIGLIISVLIFAILKYFTILYSKKKEKKQ